MSDISALAQGVAGINALSGLVLITPQVNNSYQPQNPFGTSSEQQPPPAFLFHYEGENSVTLESDITDHYIEDNTPIQDQIALKPEGINTHGFIGELNNVPPSIATPAKNILDKLTSIGAYTPALTTTALNAFNTATQLYSTAENASNAAVSAVASLTKNSSTGASSGTQTKQQVAFSTFYGYWQNKILFTVQTPWAQFKNCAIKSLRAIQDAETRVISDFEVSFKVMRFATIVTVNNGITSDFQGRAAAQGADLVNLGSSTPPPVSLGLLNATTAVA